MNALKLARLIGAMTMVASTPALLALAAHAQTSPPATLPHSHNCTVGVQQGVSVCFAATG